MVVACAVLAIDTEVSALPVRVAAPPLPSKDTVVRVFDEVELTDGVVYRQTPNSRGPAVEPAPQKGILPRDPKPGTW